MKPVFDEEQAATFIGKHVIVGLSKFNHEGELLERKQFHGDIVRVDRREGIDIKQRESGEEFKLPPDTSAFEDAPPGEYQFKSTGTVVVNPDLMTTWTITLPRPKREDSKRDDSQKRQEEKA